MTYNLTLIESYIIFGTLSKIYNNNLETKDKYHSLPNEFNFTNTMIKQITNRTIIKNIVWVKNVYIERGFIFIEFNQEIFNILNQNFINFIKEFSFNYSHVETIKISELLFNNSKKIILTTKDLKCLDGNLNIKLDGLKREFIGNRRETTNDFQKLRTIIGLINHIENINKDIFYYIKYLKQAIIELKDIGINFKYKVAIKIIDGKEEVVIIIRKIKVKSLNTYVKPIPIKEEIINNSYFPIRLSVSNYIKKKEKDAIQSSN